MWLPLEGLKLHDLGWTLFDNWAKAAQQEAEQGEGDVNEQLEEKRGYSESSVAGLKKHSGRGDAQSDRGQEAAWGAGQGHGGIASSAAAAAAAAAINMHASGTDMASQARTGQTLCPSSSPSFHSLATLYLLWITRELRTVGTATQRWNPKDNVRLC